MPPDDAWLRQEPVVEQHGDISVVQEHHLPGGSKARFLPFLVGQARELVFGGPFCGGAPYAMAVYAHRMGLKATLFYAKRNELHWRQKEAFRLGAQIFQVPAGRMSVVQARARAYAQDHQALFLPLGFDIATDPYVALLAALRARLGRFDEVWCATGSGMLARCLGRAFPDARVHGVAVGLKSRHSAQEFPANVELWDCDYDFGEECITTPPFSSCPNYDAKAWETLMMHGGADRGRVLFFNVLGSEPQPNV